VRNKGAQGLDGGRSRRWRPLRPSFSFDSVVILEACYWPGEIPSGVHSEAREAGSQAADNLPWSLVLPKKADIERKY
jgi:hypothetical protein